MANPQIENGYTKIANELLDAMCKLYLSGNQWKVLHAVIRKTYGWNKTTDWITATQIAEMTGIHPPHVSTALHELRRRKIILRERRLIAVQKDYDQWQMTAPCNFPVVTRTSNLQEPVTLQEPVINPTRTSKKSVQEPVRTKDKRHYPKDSSQALPKKPREPTENQLWVRDIAQVCHLPTKKPPGVGRIAKVAKQYREAGYKRSDIMAFAIYWESDPWRKQKQPMSVNILQRMSDFGAWVDAGKPLRANSGKGKAGDTSSSHDAINRAVQRIKEREGLS